jgi:hypothetical protein
MKTTIGLTNEDGDRADKVHVEGDDPLRETDEEVDKPW